MNKLKESYTRAAKLQEALKIDDEIKRMQEQIKVTASPPVGSTPEKLSARASIPSNSPDAYRIGPVKAGDTLTLKYIDGKWKSHGVQATENPDDPTAYGGNDNRLVIAEASAGGVPGALIVIVPPETAKKSFTHVFEEAHENVVLRINANSTKANPGSVTYSVKLERVRS